MKIRKYTKAILASLGLLLAPVLATSCATAEAATDEVYICTGPKAKVYHSTPKCKGLDKCSGKIKKVPKSSTKRRGCKICTHSTKKTATTSHQPITQDYNIIQHQ